MFAGTGTEQKLHFNILNRNRNRKLTWTETGTGTETGTEINTKKLTNFFFDSLTHNCFYSLIHFINWEVCTQQKNCFNIIYKIQKLCKISAHIWTEISAGTEISDIAGTETGISVPIPISAGTGIEPNFGRSLVRVDLEKLLDDCNADNFLRDIGWTLPQK